MSKKCRKSARRCGWGDHCNHCNHSSKHNSNHLSVNQWLRSAVPDSQQPTSPIGFLFLKLPPPPCAVLLVYYIFGASLVWWWQRQVGTTFSGFFDWGLLGLMKSSPNRQVLWRIVKHIPLAKTILVRFHRACCMISKWSAQLFTRVMRQLQLPSESDSCQVSQTPSQKSSPFTYQSGYGDGSRPIIYIFGWIIFYHMLPRAPGFWPITI